MVGTIKNVTKLSDTRGLIVWLKIKNHLVGIYYNLKGDSDHFAKYPSVN